MAFHYLMAEMVRRIPGKSVCEFGNQRFKARHVYPFESTKDYYASIGYERYVALDINEEMDAVIADLNYPVDLGETFDLVTNNGTGEHLFDQRAVFENAHNLSHKYILHILPMSPWINHGFYNFNPILFRDLSIANNYKMELKIGDRDANVAKINSEEFFREKNPLQLIELVKKFGGDVSVIALMKKTSNQPFRIPMQGKYKPDIADEELRRAYG